MQTLTQNSTSSSPPQTSIGQSAPTTPAAKSGLNTLLPLNSNTNIQNMPSDRQKQQQLTPNDIVPECQGCLCQIHDRYYLQVMDKAWHLSCLRCADCKFSLDTQQTCFSKDGVIYCKEDYYK